MLSAIFDTRTDAGRIALAYVESNEHSLEPIADALCIQLQKPDDYADRYLKRLPEAVEELRMESGGGVLIPTGVTKDEAAPEIAGPEKDLR